MNVPGTNSEATVPGAPAAHGLTLRRRVVSAAELRRWLTARVRTHRGCESVEVIGLFRLEKSDQDGCNWSHTLVVDPAGTPAPAYALACADAVVRGRALFMLAS